MRRVIYSLYVDVPAKEHYGDSKQKYDTTEKADITIQAFKENYGDLIKCKKHYADIIDADFIMFEYDEQYKTFERNFLKDFPMFTGYEVVNFYKIHLLDKLAKEYDDILYLDFDAIPMTDESFFDKWDLSKGICVKHNNSMVNTRYSVSQGIRSPSAKYFNCHAMLLNQGYNPRNDVINTGIIGANKDDILKLNYFGKFKDTIDLMTTLIKEKDGLYPENIVNMFRYDNETIFSYKIKTNNVNVQWLDNEWHYFFDKQRYVPDNTKIAHCVCKDFDAVWRKYNA
tara:strand:- start:17290 stop:18141 length:852 start_codon:yes stop_codon:yes gene_type:complete